MTTNEVNNMARTSYQYETSPRKYEPEYTTRKITKKQAPKVSKKEIEKRLEKERAKKAEERKKKAKQIFAVAFVFVMLLSLSYREIQIMEMFDQKKEQEDKLALIQKENGQIEKNIKEEESKLEWNTIKQRATEELGMEVKTGIPINLERTDNVETENKYIKEDETSWLEKIVSFFVNR